MGFELKVPDSLRRIAQRYDEKFKDKVAKVLETALEQEITVITKRTQSGTGVEGDKLKAYTPGYAAWKSGYTRSGKPRKKSGKSVRSNFGGGRVTLSLTGDMLRGLRSKVKVAKGYIEGVIFFLSSQSDKARRNNETRKFFGLSKEQVNRIQQQIRNALK